MKTIQRNTIVIRAGNDISIISDILYQFMIQLTSANVWLFKNP